MSLIHPSLNSVLNSEQKMGFLRFSHAAYCHWALAHAVLSAQNILSHQQILQNLQEQLVPSTVKAFSNCLSISHHTHTDTYTRLLAYKGPH